MAVDDNRLRRALIVLARSTGPRIYTRLRRCHSSRTRRHLVRSLRVHAPTHCRVTPDSPPLIHRLSTESPQRRQLLDFSPAVPPPTQPAPVAKSSIQRLPTSTASTLSTPIQPHLSIRPLVNPLFHGRRPTRSARRFRAIRLYRTSIGPTQPGKPRSSTHLYSRTCMPNDRRRKLARRRCRRSVAVSTNVDLHATFGKMLA
jgi:hypothetical protein